MADQAGDQAENQPKWYHGLIQEAETLSDVSTFISFDKRAVSLYLELSNALRLEEWPVDLSVAAAERRKLVEACEKVHALLPQDHAFKQEQPPRHLQLEPVRKKEGVASKTRCVQQPSLEPFSGLDVLRWPEWKAIFGQEVTQQEDLSEEVKYRYLAKSVRSGSPAEKIVKTYKGVNRAFTLAWAALIRKFDHVSRTGTESSFRRDSEASPTSQKRVFELEKTRGVVRRGVGTHTGITRDGVTTHHVRTSGSHKYRRGLTTRK